MIKILIADDSPTETAVLKSLFEAESDLKVVGCAHNGEEAVNLARKLKPDVITMDIAMPVMDGLEATRLIMSHTPTPIVIISSRINDKLMDATFQSLEAGAVTVLEKPANIMDSSSSRKRQHMIDTLRSMSEIKVFKRRFFISKREKSSSLVVDTSVLSPGEYELVAIASSIGGPQVLKLILAKLPIDFPSPIMVVQHMTAGFIEGFTEWLNDHSDLTVKYAQNNEVLMPGTMYFAPDHHHLQVGRADGKLICKLTNGPPVSGFCPSATVLLESVAKVCGKKAIGLILTGMGSDGAEGLLALKKRKGHTLIQDPKSAVVFGMAAVAQSLGAVDKVVELNQIADYLIKMTTKKD